MAKKDSGGAVATVKANEVVDPATLAGFADFAGAGLQNLGKEDLAIPFLAILQGLSPQVQRSKGEYIEGAAEGMLFNTVTKELIDPLKTPVTVICCAYERWFIEWRLRENGGGFLKQHAPDPKIMEATTRDEKGRDITAAGTQLNDTRSFYALVTVGDGEDAFPQPAFISMTSTQIKKSRQWLMQQNMLKLKGPNGMYTPPMYASKWKVTTVPESNEKGSWMGWAFEFAGYLKGPQDPIFVEAKAFADSVAAGAVKADLSRSAEAMAGGEGGREPGSDDDLDDGAHF